MKIKFQALKSKMQIFAFCAIMFFMCISMIKYSSELVSAVAQSVQRCLNIIIPSLFAFMALCQIMLKSGIYTYLSKPFYPISKYIMNIPADLFFVFLVGSIGGYPVGIKLLSDLKKRGEISNNTANAMSCFCYCGGPAFFSGTIGLAVFGNHRIGMLVFLSVLLSNFTLGCIVCRIFKPCVEINHKKINFSGDILTEAVISAGRSMFTICVMIIFFSALIQAVSSVGFFSLIKSLFGLSDNALVIVKSVFEITCLAELSGTPYNLLPVISAICSFGGICVIVQISALVKSNINLKYFLIFRPVLAIFSYLFCLFLKHFLLPQNIETVAAEKILVNFNNFIPSICLILMILLLNLKKGLVFSE